LYVIIAVNNALLPAYKELDKKAFRGEKFMPERGKKKTLLVKIFKWFFHS